MKVQCAHGTMRKLEDLKPHPKNPNQHPERQIDLLAKILKKTGWRSPIIVSRRSGFVTKGHGRLMAARRAGFSQVPVDEQDYLDDAEELADMIADNEIAELAEMDIDLRGSVLSDLESMDYPLELVSFADGLEPEEVFEGLVDEDEVPEPPEEPVTKPGDLWQLGDHRLLCGDSTSADDVARLMDGEKANIMVTDPPYNVEYEGNYIQSGRILKKEQKVWSGGIANDNLSNFGEWLASAFAASDAAIDTGAAIYVWHPSGEDGRHFWAAWPYDLWHFQVDLIWNKTSLIISRWDYKPQHEPCMYGWKGKNRSWIGPNNEPTVWDIPRQQGASGETREHPTQKPTECMARAIRNHKGSAFDPFLGSGTTLIACEQLNRKCYGMEIEPAYCDVIVKRWEDFTGKKAELIKS